MLRRAFLMRWDFRLRWLSYAGGAMAALVLIASVLLWWRLGNGPIEFDFATPWLTAAIEENFGSQHHVQVGEQGAEEGPALEHALEQEPHPEPNSTSDLPHEIPLLGVAGCTGLEPVASGVTGRRYNQLN